MRHAHSHRGHGRRFARRPARGDDMGHRHDGHGHGGHRHDGDDEGGRRGRHRHGGGRGVGRGSGRMFDHGELRFVVLHLIGEQPRHGYELIKEIEDRVAGTYTPSPGVIYPTLTMLEELGHATVTESGGKKLYAITEDGIAWLAANQAAVDGALAHMQEVRAANSGGPAPAIVRAMENLKLALRLRQGRGPLTEEQVRGIAETLDAAALAVERS